jgi:hypothetical protein
MAKKTVKKSTKQLATETAAKPATGAIGVSSQALRPLAASKPFPSPAQQVQKAPENVAAPQVPIFPAGESPKPSAQSEPTKSLGRVGEGAEGTVPPGSPRVRVTFVFPVCQCCAKHVSLSGDFNGWSPDATPMKRYDDGHWETTLELAPGRYEYKFVRDGEWMPDLLALENVLNQHGTLNSVIEVQV